MNKIIVTAFEPFGEEQTNPTMKLLEHIPETLYDAQVVKTTLPVVYNHAFDRLLPLIETHEPQFILMLGLAKGRTHVNVERIAININDASNPDNLGNVLHELPVVEGGTDGFFTNVDLKAILKKAADQHLPLHVSNTAGAYVCNNLYYHVLHHIKTFNLSTKAVFVHVPMLIEDAARQNRVPSLPLNTMLDSVMAVLDVVMNPVDVKKQSAKVDKGQKAL